MAGHGILGGEYDGGRISRAYNEWSSVYDAIRNATRDLNSRVLREAGLPLEGRKLLEIGCGTGLNTAFLAESAAEVVGVDFSVGMLERARERVKSANVQFRHADVTLDWPFGDASFDGIVGNLVLEHIRDLRPVFSEAERVLRLNGFLYLAELHPFKQLSGSQARYTPGQSMETVFIDAYYHPVSEYVNGGIEAGFTLDRTGEWHTDDETLPRLLTLLFTKR